jgi:hypothetical protein
MSFSDNAFGNFDNADAKELISAINFPDFSVVVNTIFNRLLQTPC